MRRSREGELSIVTPEAKDKFSMPERFLERDHASLAGRFAELQTLLVEGEVERSFEILDLIWARLAIHIRAEHLRLFPAILTAPAWEAATSRDMPQLEYAEAAVKRLRGDHDFFMHELASAVNILRSLKGSGKASTTELDEVRAKVAQVAARLEEHNRIEEEQVYKWVALLLTKEEQAALLRRIEREFEKLPPRFEGREIFSQ